MDQSVEQLKIQMVAIRHAIREHRDQVGDYRYMADDFRKKVAC